MITMPQAIAIVQDNLPRPSIEQVALSEALQRILAGDVSAREPSPRYTNSAMDGFAVRWSDVHAATDSQPVFLQLVGESQAGAPFRGTVLPGQAARISTGAMLCDGADSIVPIEDCRVEASQLAVLQVRAKGQHLRREGEEFQTGDPLLAAGTRLGPPHLALLAGQGVTEVPVYTRPAIGIIVTGSELVPPEQTPSPWQIRDSNSTMLSGAVEQSQGKVAYHGYAADSLPETVEVLQAATRQSDIILFSGGVSVGPHDLVKAAAEECGFQTCFWRVHQKPGKPLFFARAGDKLLFGLPGNPVSAYMCYLYYVHPVLQHLHGGAFATPARTAIAAVTIENSLARAHMMRVRIDGDRDSLPLVTPLGRQGSHMLTTVSNAGGFIVLQAGQRLIAGSKVDLIGL